jgi:hypothetical protein
MLSLQDDMVSVLDRKNLGNFFKNTLIGSKIFNGLDFLDMCLGMVTVSQMW